MVASRFCYRRREGCAMTPYESIMVVIAFLSLLIAVDVKNRKYSEPPVSWNLIGGLVL